MLFGWKNRLTKRQVAPPSPVGGYRPLPQAGGSEAFRPPVKAGPGAKQAKRGLRKA